MHSSFSNWWINPNSNTYYLHNHLFFNKILFIFCWYLWFFIFMLLFLFFFYATFIFFSYLYIFQFKNSIFWCKKKSLFMLENKTKEMYLFSQNVSRIFFFYFIKNNIRWLKTLQAKNCNFWQNIWADHHMDSLIPIPKIRIFTNYFTNMNFFLQKTGIVLKH